LRPRRPCCIDYNFLKKTTNRDNVMKREDGADGLQVASSVRNHRGVDTHNISIESAIALRQASVAAAKRRWRDRTIWLAFRQTAR
jgi:hypothetical protein